MLITLDYHLSKLVLRINMFYFYRDQINKKRFIKTKLIFFKFFRNPKHILPLKLFNMLS